MFAVGFLKVASSHNNQGLEFNKADTNNTNGTVGPGGMAPQGLESYEPSVNNSVKGPKKFKKMNPQEVAQFLMSKSAKVSKNRGATSRQADGIVSGLKKDKESNDSTYADVFASIAENKENHDNYIRAGLK